MKKIIVTVLAAAMALGSVAAVYGAEYTDVKPGNWANEAISTMSDKAIVKGYPDGTFKPQNTIACGEFIKMALIAATGEDAGNAESGNWALNYYNSALDRKYFTEYDIGKSTLNSPITRAKMALIVSAILGDVKIQDYDEIQQGITDITYKTKYEYDITKSYASGILTGYTDKAFKPNKTLFKGRSGNRNLPACG
ncbi:MAG: S-layer homology domain-containing protein [Eubacteriales bacterium]|nr:S-layer homology domain-containing protein [Eubacteriales bacterium]